MTNSLKWLVLAPLANLVGNSLGTMLALQHNLVGDFGGAFYTIAQLGEPIVLQVWSPGGFDPAQAVVLFVNVASAIAMLVLGIRAWRTMRASVPVTG